MGRKKKAPPNPAFTTIGDWHDNQFVPLFANMLESELYINLSSAAKEAYTILRLQYKGSFTGNTIKCSYKRFEKMGMRRNTVARAIVELECFGFIAVNHGGLRHMNNEYTFIETWKTRTFAEASELYEKRKAAKIREKNNRKQYKRI